MATMFRCPIRGESMGPKYAGGSEVHFRIIEPVENRHRRRFELPVYAGKDYYVLLGGGRATFKRVYKAGRRSLLLGPINRQLQQKRGFFRVSRSKIVGLAVAVGVLIPKDKIKSGSPGTSHTPSLGSRTGAGALESAAA